MADTRMVESRLSAWARPHRAFLIITAIFGSILIVLVPPFQSQDEFNHFLRAYQISEGDFVSRGKDRSGLSGNFLPVSFTRVDLMFAALPGKPNVKTSAADIRRAMQVRLNPQERVFCIFANTTHNCPAGYLAQCVGIYFGRLLNLPAVLLLYLGRATNLLMWIVLGWLALRLAPAIARALFLLLLMPMSLVLAASVSADPTTTATAALFTALICRYFVKPAPSIDRKAMVVLTIVSIPLSISKMAYLPMAGLILLVPARKFGGPAKCAAKILLLAAINLTAVAAWASASSTSLDTQIRISQDASARVQLQWLEQHPAAITGLLRNTFHVYGWLALQSYVGMVGYFDEPLPIPFAVGYAVLLLLACWFCERLPPLPHAFRAAVVILPVFVVTCLIIALLSYLYWCSPGMSYIDGLNGRYLIPLTPPVLLLLCSASRGFGENWKIRWSRANLDLVAALISVGVCCYYLGVVWNRYYG